MDPSQLPTEERADFPRTGVRARRWFRFERDLNAWLATPEGQFASWDAERALSASASR
ncbi:MAG: hypothetical protein JHC95_07490 [Solirubrobacteraceae bacterium]|nr:hypothetical protein [Solirubrobacteraceae bacterium]